MARLYRSVSKCNGGGELYIHVDTAWMTYAECRRWILGKYGHIPPWQFITSISDYSKLQRKFL